MHLSGIIVGSVTLHIVSLFCACVRVILSLATAQLTTAFLVVWCMPIEMYGASLIGKQVGVCVSTFKYWLH